jgi:hypothetical protein
VTGAALLQMKKASTRNLDCATALTVANPCSSESTASSVMLGKESELLHTPRPRARPLNSSRASPTLLTHSSHLLLCC